MPEPTPLAEHELHVWIASADVVRDPMTLGACRQILTTEELARAERYRFEPGRHECIVARALARTTLSRYSDIQPADWRFVTNEYGRPDVAPEFATRLRFNLSHSHGLVVCAVVLDREVGVDVEATDRRAATVEIANRFFSAPEVDSLRNVAAERQRDQFFAYWTLKESYIKARGMGLALPLGRFSFHIPDEQPIQISIDPRLDDDAASWQFELHRPSERHRLAIAVRRGAAPDLAVQIRRVEGLFRA